LSSVKAIVTGASGFVGRALVRRLGAFSPLAFGSASWREHLAAAELREATVFHLAARVHSPGATPEAFTGDNVEKTEALAQAAASKGASRIVFLSSIKVNGEESVRALQPADREAPADAYARSKWAGERALREVASRTGISVCIVRAPLVIGEGAKGNLAALMRLADTPWPLPFGSIDNRRTLVHVDDLADLLVLCGSQPKAHMGLYFAGHPEAVSTARLVRTLRGAFDRPSRLFPVPAGALEALGALANASDKVRRLTRSLEVDVTATERELGWKNAVPMDEGIQRMARAYRQRGAAA
jgi:nucleoside-diphosphate-sugar epimerase